MRVLFALSLMVLLAGCVEGPPASRPPEMSFANMKPVEVNAASVEVHDNYTPPMQEPNIEHKFQTPPYVAAESMLRHQLVAAGSENILRAIIEDASVTRDELPVDKTLINTFIAQPTERLKARLRVRFELVNSGAPDVVLGHAQVATSREKTLNGNVSPAERDKAYFTLTEDLMNDLDSGLQSSVRNTFGLR